MLEMGLCSAIVKNSPLRVQTFVQTKVLLTKRDPTFNNNTKFCFVSFKLGVSFCFAQSSLYSGCVPGCKNIFKERGRER